LGDNTFKADLTRAATLIEDLYRNLAPSLTGVGKPHHGSDPLQYLPAHHRVHRNLRRHRENGDSEASSTEGALDEFNE